MSAAMRVVPQRFAPLSLCEAGALFVCPGGRACVSARVPPPKLFTIHFLLFTEKRRTTHGLQPDRPSAPDRLPHAGRPAQAGAGHAPGHVRPRSVPQDGGAQRGQAQVCPPRRPPLRQRQHPHRHRPEQDPQGHHRQAQEHDRPLRPLCARLGHPRPAHRVRRAEGQEGQAGRDDHRPVPHQVPGVRRGLYRQDDRAVPAPGGAGRVGEPLHHPAARV